MTQKAYTPRTGDFVLISKKLGGTKTLSIEGTVVAVLDHQEHGLSVRLDGLDNYIHLGDKTGIVELGK